MLIRLCKFCVLPLIIISFGYPNNVFAEGSLTTTSNNRYTVTEGGLSIRLSKWKNDHQSAISFTWDDNNWTVKKCSEIFDKYHYKCTFFINPGSYMSNVLLQDYKNAADKGFEIGNHGYSHVRLDVLGITGLNKEIVDAKNMIACDYKQCLSFAYPFHLSSVASDSVIKHTHPFCRNFAKKNNNVMAAAHDKVNTYQSRVDSINKSFSNNNWIIFGGHGIDNNGYNPVPSFEVDSILNYVSHKNIWVDTFAEVCKYYLAYQSASIQASPYVVTINSDYLKELEKFKIRSCEMTLSIESDKELKFMGNNIINTTSSLTKNGGFNYLINVDIAISNKLMYLYKTIENPPVAVAGPNQLVYEGTTISLDGSASMDPENDSLTFIWTAPDDITLSSTHDNKPTFTAPEVTTNTDYTFTLVVNDGKVDSSPSTIKVTVLPAINEGESSIANPLFKIFPNPTQSQFTIEFTENLNEGYQVSVSTLIGTSIFKEDVNEERKLMIDLSNQPNGIYILKVKAGKRVYINKIGLQK